MSDYYYAIAAIAYGIFIIQFILSWFGGDTDLDVNLDGDVDMDVGDIVSFKGLIHFLMGSFGYLAIKEYTTGEIFWWDYLIALALGILFVIVLYYLYKLLMRLEHDPKVLQGEALIGKMAHVYLKKSNDSLGRYRYTISVDNNNGTVELNAISIVSYDVGDTVIVKGFEENVYLI